MPQAAVAADKAKLVYESGTGRSASSDYSTARTAGIGVGVVATGVTAASYATAAMTATVVAGVG